MRIGQTFPVREARVRRELAAPPKFAWKVTRESLRFATVTWISRKLDLIRIPCLCVVMRQLLFTKIVVWSGAVAA
jgi:hypothetical protein